MSSEQVLFSAVDFLIQFVCVVGFFGFLMFIGHHTITGIRRWWR